MSLRKEEKSAFALLLETKNNDMVDEVVRRVPPFSLAAPFFAQRSHDWRSYLYRQQLARARYICDEESQERVLTHLLINLSLLTDLPMESNADRAAWIVYLKNYAEDMSLAIKNRLLANALWLALDLKHTEAQWNKFVYLLERYCLRGRLRKVDFYGSLLMIVARASGDKWIGQGAKLDFHQLLSLRTNYIETSFEAQIILAPYEAELAVANGEIIAEIQRAYISNKAVMNYVCLLHAAVQLIPEESPFWQNYSAKNFTFIYDAFCTEKMLVVSRFHYERINLLITLMSRTKFDIQAKRWKTRLNRASKVSDDLTERLFLNLLCEASEMAKLYKDEDEEDKAKLNWLKSIFFDAGSELKYSLFSLAPRVCAKLKTDSARRAAVNFLMKYEKKHQAGHRQQDVTINLIKTLILSQQMSEEKKKLGKECFEIVCTAPYSDMDSLFSVLDFLDDAEYDWCNRNFTHAYAARLFFADVSKLIESTERRVESLTIFKLIIDDPGFVKNYRVRFPLYDEEVKKAYTLLLCKQVPPQPDEIKKWNYQLTSLFDKEPKFCLKMIKILLPHLDLDDKKAWMDLLLSVCFATDPIVDRNGVDIRDANRSNLLKCLAVGMASLPTRVKQEYSHRIATEFLSADIFNYSNLIEIYVNLFQQLCDIDIPQLEQRQSFLNNQITRQGAPS